MAACTPHQLCQQMAAYTPAPAHLQGSGLSAYAQHWSCTLALLEQFSWTDARGTTLGCGRACRKVFSLEQQQRQQTLPCLQPAVADDVQ